MPCSGWSPATTPHIAGSAASAQLAAMSESRSLSLTLTTREGDTVTLSLAARSEALHLGYQEAGWDGSRFQGTQVELSAFESERSLSLTVEGDLNPEERREIGKVLKAVNRMMEEFVAGRLEPAIERTERLARLRTLSSLELEMSASQVALEARQSAYQAASAAPPALYDPQGRPVGGLPPAGWRRPNFPDQQLAAEAESLTAAMAGELQPLHDSGHRLQGPLAGLFNRQRRGLAERHPAQRAGTALLDRMQQDLLARLGLGGAPLDA
jgi:hypothetical protein